VCKEPVRKVDLNYEVYPHLDYIVQQREKPKMTESLRLMVEDIIADVRMRQPELASGVTSNHVLLALASQGCAVFEDICPFTLSEPRSPVNYGWTATEQLIDYLETGGSRTVKRTKRRRPKLRLDAVLSERLEVFLRALGGACLSKQEKRLFKIRSLLAQEKDGLVIPYKDADGRLAWRASEHLNTQTMDLLNSAH
jgi:hypothetical protein